MSAEKDWAYRVDAAARGGKTHQCCVLDCDAQTLLGLFACRDHWLALPRATRYTLGQAFIRHQTHPEIYAEGVALARRLLNERVVA
jgi:hypothetical protein